IIDENLISDISEYIESEQSLAFIDQLNPLKYKEYDLQYNVDLKILNDYLEEEFKGETYEPVEPVLAFNPVANGYTVIPGINGIQADGKIIIEAISEKFSCNNLDCVQKPIDLSLEIGETEPIILLDKANEIATHLNNYGNADNHFFAVDSEGSGIVTAKMSIADFASFIDILPDYTNRTFSFAPNISKIDLYLNDNVRAQTNRNPDNIIYLTDRAGNRKAQIKRGQDGFTVKSFEGVSQKVKEAIESNQAVDIGLDVEVAVAPRESIQKYIETNLSAKTVTLYENGNVVATFPISGGKPGSPTSAGNFEIWIKYTVKDLGCDGHLPWCSRNVQWVSFFNSRGEAFHSAPWNNSIGFEHLSHGCVNMYTANAKFLYDWAPIGTEVWNHW
ncbi:MAG: L,D-transpeptidase, partial [Bifidobacteriaceae bacterium]|nr:L,D-transpeptidase [Bifidobacteriaceae bacterium]